MTGAAQVLAELAKHGLRVRVAGDRLAVSPPSALTPELRALVLAEKPALVALLEQPPVDATIARREVLGFPATLLPKLPLATTLEIEFAGGEILTVATHANCSAAAQWSAAEWHALVLAAEHERTCPHTLRMWLARKRAEPNWILTEAEALELPASQPARGWSVERVLRQLGAALRDVRINGGES